MVIHNSIYECANKILLSISDYVSVIKIQIVIDQWRPLLEYLPSLGRGTTIHLRIGHPYISPADVRPSNGFGSLAYNKDATVVVPAVAVSNESESVWVWVNVIFLNILCPGRGIRSSDNNIQSNCASITNIANQRQANAKYINPDIIGLYYKSNNNHAIKQVQQYHHRPPHHTPYGDSVPNTAIHLVPVSKWLTFHWHFQMLYFQWKNLQLISNFT